jgi:hypothetical protein
MILNPVKVKGANRQLSKKHISVAAVHFTTKPVPARAKKKIDGLLFTGYRSRTCPANY